VAGEICNGVVHHLHSLLTEQFLHAFRMSESLLAGKHSEAIHNPVSRHVSRCPIHDPAHHTAALSCANASRNGSV
jgi:hypothetical protein